LQTLANIQTRDQHLGSTKNIAAFFSFFLRESFRTVRCNAEVSVDTVIYPQIESAWGDTVSLQSVALFQEQDKNPRSDNYKSCRFYHCCCVPLKWIAPARIGEKQWWQRFLPGENKKKFSFCFLFFFFQFFPSSTFCGNDFDVFLYS
jgi:hypothetical protein